MSDEKKPDALPWPPDIGLWVGTPEQLPDLEDDEALEALPWQYARPDVVGDGEEDEVEDVYLRIDVTGPDGSERIVLYRLIMPAEATGRSGDYLGTVTKDTMGLAYSAAFVDALGWMVANPGLVPEVVKSWRDGDASKLFNLATDASDIFLERSGGDPYKWTDDPNQQKAIASIQLRSGFPDGIG